MKHFLAAVAFTTMSFSCHDAEIRFGSQQVCLSGASMDHRVEVKTGKPKLVRAVWTMTFCRDGSRVGRWG